MSVATDGPDRPAASLPEGTVTVLFTDLVDSTHLNQQYGDEVANSVRRDLEQLALSCVDRNRGHLVKGLGDGLMVAFQSARRAVACAQEIQRAVAGRTVRPGGPTVSMRIGLHTGEVITEDGDLHGETVIIAKRIEGVAPAGGILVSDTVHGVLGTARSELVDRGEFELKGIDVPWRLYEVPVPAEAVEPPRAGGGTSPCVGREAELRVLADAVSAARAGRGAVLLVSGEAGAGKTRLIREAAAAARQQEMAVLVGHCLEMEMPAPYQPVLDQLEQTARALAPEEFRAILGENAAEVARLMPELHRSYDDIGEPPVLPADQERRYLLHGLGRFVERAALRQPLMLCYEDVHWADEASLLFIETLSQLAPNLPLLIVASYRPAEVSPRDRFARTLEDLIRHRLATEVKVGALSEEQVGLLLAGRAGQDPPPELVRLIYDETEGNPFFVEEVFLHLCERGTVFDSDGRWRTGIAIADTEVPRSVRLVIARRLERTSEDVRRVLSAAAVVGRQTDFDLLTALTGLDEDPLLDALEEAERAQLVHGTAHGPEVVYGFVHEQIRQTLLADLSAIRRQRLHLRVADVLEARAGANIGERAADIAHHLQLAGTAAPAERRLRQLEMAARFAISAVAPEDALRHVESALELVAPDDAAVRSSLLVLRSQADRAMGRIDDALADLAVALEIEPPGPDHDAILRGRAGLHLDLFNGAAAALDLESALTSARSRGDRQAELDALLSLGRAHYVRSLDDPALAVEARDTYEKAHTLAAELGNRRAMAEALIPTTWFTDYWIDYRSTAEANVREARQIAEELADDTLSIEVDSAALRLLRGRPAAELGQQLRERLEARHDPVRLKEHYFWLMWHYQGRGELERCVETCDLGMELAAQLGSAPVQYGTIKAIALTELGRFDAVDAALEQEVTDEGHPFGQACAAFGRAFYLARLEAREPAGSAVLDAMRRACDLSRVWMQQVLLDLAVVLLVHPGDAGGDSLATARWLAEANGLRPGTLSRAEETLAKGDAAGALHILLPRVERMEELGQLRDLTWVLECIARASAAAGDPGAVLYASERGLRVAEQTGQLPVSWRLNGWRAEALSESGRVDEAAEARQLMAGQFATLSSRVPDPALREWFERQTPAARSTAAAPTEPGSD